MSPALAELERELSSSELITDAAAEPYLRDASTAVPGLPMAVLLAGTRSDVSAALGWAHRHRIPVTARGAGTGVSGGATAMGGGLTLVMTGMDRVVDLRPGDRLAVVQPGVVVDDLDRRAREHGLMFAPDPASSALATIGGAIATNAGGFHCLRHGVTADSVAGLEIVLADGRVLRTGAASRKNVAGYDLTRLFVGSEGTLGVVTEATVRLVPVPRGERVTFQVAFPSIAGAGAAVAAVMASPLTPELLELVDRVTARLVEEFAPSGLDTNAAATLIGQLVGTDVLTQVDEVRRLMVACGGTAFAAAPDESLLEARRRVHSALAAHGMGVSWMSSDAAVPPSRLAELLDTVTKLQEDHDRLVSVVAHAGDGNIHAAVAADPEDPGDLTAANHVVELIARKAVQLGGTVTGEHGIGSVKYALLDTQFDPVSREVHRRVKQALDPLGILNPGRAI